jgi:uncharacterized protein YgiM (DUF1202 family)
MTMLNAAKSGRGMLMVAALCGALAGFGARAHADETVRLNTEANLRARPGERAPTLAVLDEGQSVRVIGRQGRWIKVTYKGRVGWLTRTQVTEDEDGVSARSTAEKKRSASTPKARKAWSSGMDDDAVGEDAVEPDDDSAAAADDDSDADAPKAKKVAKAEPKKAKKVVKTAKKSTPAKGSTVELKRTATLREKPSTKADELWDADKGTSMKVVAVSGDGAWLKVQDDDGQKGWIAAKDVSAPASDGDDEGSAVSSDDEDSAPAASDDGDDEDAPRKVTKKAKKHASAASKKGAVMISAHANLGILSKSQAYSSGGTGLRANYQLANTAPAVIAGGGLTKDMGGYTIGVDGAVMLTVGGSGIKIAGATMGAAGTTLSWKAMEIDARAKVGYAWDKKKGYAVEGHVGYHTSSVTVAVDDTAKLPSERLSGVLVGAGLVLPQLSPKIGLCLGADYMVNAKLEQTKGLSDGTSSAVSAFYIGAEGTYNIKPKMDVHAYTQVALEGFGFAGTNEREATAMNAQRKDTQYVVGLGLSYLF